MKSIIKVEKAANGYIVEGKETGVKKVAENEEAAAKIVANDLVQVFESMGDGEIKTIEFDVK